MENKTIEGMYQGLTTTAVDFVKRNETLKTLAARVYRRSMSPNTVMTYITLLKQFFSWLGKEPDEALKGRYDWAGVINDYLDYLIAKEISPKRIRNSFTAIKKWCTLNNIQLDWKSFELPSIWKVEEEKLPTKEDLRQILRGADMTEKAIFTILLSSGLRVGTLIKLRLKNLDLNYDCPLITVRPEVTKMRHGYITFMSPEAKQMLMLYLKEREMNGEKITPESLVVVREKPRGAPLSLDAVERRWARLLRKADKAIKGRKWYLTRVHSLRKYFKSWCSLSGIPGELVERFMGHKTGIAQTYFLPDIESATNPEVVKRILEEYKKALPALTIFGEDEKVKELEKKIEEQKQALEEERKKHEEEKARLEAERKALEERLSRLEAMIEEVSSLRRRSLLERAN
ncbi:MAG: hypothetical protein DSO08_00755 [Candidatus Methanomethylicota archaeon]|uniref:Tyr recombinase domain-containing protein n=1 Tax=Thermoproteota archaeon TaxID=2056631 RepID=A0A523BGN6_9CREN|nr:MAG: hypothetical protein DSO08_00755 [Candidatus Verstraetearchaeota archaeon]